MKKASLLLLFVFPLLLIACGNGDSAPPAEGPAGAPAVSVDLPFNGTLSLDDVDPALATQGEELFTTRCTTCHRMGERYVGPDLTDVMTQRTPEWVMNMILAPEIMIFNDPDAKALLAEYSIPMTNQNLTEAEARSIVEYLRTTAPDS